MYNSDHTATECKKKIFSSLLNQLMSSLDSFIQLCGCKEYEVFWIQLLWLNLLHYLIKLVKYTSIFVLHWWFQICVSLSRLGFVELFAFE